MSVVRAAFSVVVVATWGLGLVACARGAATEPAAASLPFEGTRGAEHTLVGTVYDVRAKQRIDYAALVELSRAAQYVLLGEKHDNPDHHTLEARFYAELVRGRDVALVLEMFGRDDQAILNERDLRSMEALFVQRGWQGWSWYAPVVEAALRANAPVIGGDLDQAALTTLRQHGVLGLDEDAKARLGLTAALPETLRHAMGEELAAAHCGRGAPEQFYGMVDVQFARDASLAKALEDAAVGRAGAVLVSGAGHVRTDRGAPYHLRQRVPGSIVSIAFVEVYDGATDPLAYGRAGEPLPYDFVIFTPRASDDDPCAPRGL